jgi:hypothetical protein
MCTCGKPDSARRRFLSGVAALAAFTRLRPAAAMTSGTAPGSGGMVHRSMGAVLINGKAAPAGATVASGDTVATGPDGEAVFTLGDDGFLLHPGGSVTITDHKTGDGRTARDVALGGGRLLSVFGPKQISLKTPLAEVGIRGTAVYLEARPMVTNICVCYGDAVMIPVNEPAKSEEVKTIHHDAPRRIFTPGHQPVMDSWVMFDHTDEELVMLEALLGRVPAFMRK